MKAKPLFTFFLALVLHTFCAAQGLYIKPLLEYKVQHNFSGRTFWETENFSIKNRKHFYSSMQPIAPGLFVGYQFPKNNSLEIGYIQERPRIGYYVEFVTYDSIFKNYFPNVVSNTFFTFAHKIPVNYNIPWKNNVPEGKSLYIKNQTSIGLTFYIKNQTAPSDVDFGMMQLDTDRSISVRSVAMGYHARTWLFQMGHTIEIARKGRTLFEATLQLEHAFAEVVFQQVHVAVYNGSSKKEYFASFEAKNSGLCLRLSRKFGISKLIRGI